MKKVLVTLFIIGTVFSACKDVNRKLELTKKASGSFEYNKSGALIFTADTINIGSIILTEEETRYGDIPLRDTLTIEETDYGFTFKGKGFLSGSINARPYTKFLPYGYYTIKTDIWTFRIKYIDNFGTNYEEFHTSEDSINYTRVNTLKKPLDPINDPEIPDSMVSQRGRIGQTEEEIAQQILKWEASETEGLEDAYESQEDDMSDYHNSVRNSRQPNTSNTSAVESRVNIDGSYSYEDQSSTYRLTVSNGRWSLSTAIKVSGMNQTDYSSGTEYNGTFYKGGAPVGSSNGTCARVGSSPQMCKP